MKFFLAILLTNVQGQDGSTISVYEGDNAEERAKVAYHNTLASFHNAPDVYFVVVEILDSYGRILGGDKGYREEVNHIPPEPEPEPEVEGE